MPVKDAHPIRNGIIAAVVAGIILSAIPYTRDLLLWVLTPLWNGISATVASLWNHLARQAKVPWWFFWLIMLLALPTIYRFIQSVLPKKIREPSEKDYKKDYINGINWEWNYSWDHIPDDISPFCPLCHTRLIYTEDSFKNKTTFHCETCHRDLATFDGRHHFAISAVARQIERKLKTGEWKKLVPRKTEN